MNERFQATWLDLREAADHQARAAELLEFLHAWAAEKSSLRVLDLGAGTGSNLRFLAPRLGVPQRWILLDHDAELLAQASPPATPYPVAWETVRADLAQWREQAEAVRPDLVTASALIDLVSESWLESLAAGSANLGAAVHIALSYDGNVQWSNPDPLDDEILATVNAHQERNKGLGSALGPRATERLVHLLKTHGYRVWTAVSPWMLTAESVSLAEHLIAGWVHAASEQEPARADPYQNWGARRLEDLMSARTEIRVGHRDLVALPESPR
jgi:trans-aconitate methyltransferase